MAITVRPAAQGDVESLARVHTRSWQAAYRGLFPDEFLDAMDRRERPSQWAQEVDRPETLVLAAEFLTAHGCELIGFANAGTTRDDDLPPGIAELYAIYLNPDTWGTGAGSALLQRVIATMETESRTELATVDR